MTESDESKGVVSRAAGAVGNGMAMVVMAVCLFHLLNFDFGKETEWLFRNDDLPFIGNLDEVLASAGLFFSMDVLGFNPITIVRDRLAARRAGRLAAKAEKKRLKLAAKAEKEAAKLEKSKSKDDKKNKKAEKKDA